MFFWNWTLSVTFSTISISRMLQTLGYFNAPYTRFSSEATFDGCTAMAAILSSDGQAPFQEMAINRFTNHRLHEFCYHACHEENTVNLEGLEEWICSTVVSLGSTKTGVSGTLIRGINQLYVLASSACPRPNLFHAILDRLPFRLLFREDKIGFSPLMLLADNASAEGQVLLLSLIPKLVSFRNSQANA